VARRSDRGPDDPGRLLLVATLLLLHVSPALGAMAQDAASSEPRILDRIVAVVDGDPILYSDIDRLIGLGTIRPEPGESRAALERRALERIIDNRLRLHELDRFGYDQAPIEEIDRRYQRIRDRFATEADFRAELERLGLDDEKLRLLVARQIAILTFVEERLGPRVFVGVEEIRRYYEEELVPELARRGEKAPPIEAVREEIRGVLRERRLNEEIDLWTAGLRAKADVEEFLESGPKPLPPVVPGADKRR
jgi:hypothetical protein